MNNYQFKKWIQSFFARSKNWQFIKRSTACVLVFLFLTQPFTAWAAPIVSTSGGDSLRPVINRLNTVSDPVLGAYIYSYPIEVPPGRNGLQPDLNLVYNSASENNSNQFGFGWSLDLPYIERMNKTGVDNLYSTSTTNYFLSSIDGELSASSTSSYIARTENGNFNKYTFSNNSWLMVDKNGTQYKFGYESASRQTDPNDSSRVYRWMLQEVRDTNDNYITFSYYKDAGAIYPSVIKYTGNGTTDGIFEVDFNRQSRTDAPVSYAPGFAITTNYIINEIVVKVSGTWVKKYTLAYASGNNGSRLILNSITESGQDELGAVNTLPATAISYQSTGPSWATSTTWAMPNSLTWTYGYSVQTQFVDLNGDGLSDLVQYAILQTQYGYRMFQNEYLNTLNGWATTTAWSLPSGLISTLNTPVQPQFVDLNGDGRLDLVQTAIQNTSTGYVLQNAEFLNDGSGWATSTTWALPNDFVAQQGYGVNSQFVDLNGDGLSDLVQTVAKQTINGYVLYNKEYLNTGSGWQSTDIWSLSNNFVAQYGGGVQSQFTDLNGDGLSDLVQTAIMNTINGYILYNQEYLNTGKGWILNSAWSLPNALTALYGYSVQTQFFDLNGDGLSDLVQTAPRQGAGYYLYNKEYLNNGHGWTEADPSASFSTYAYSTTAPVYFVDLDGDGIRDYIQLSASQGAGGYTLNSIEYINNAQKNDLISQLTVPEGGTTSLSYKAASQYTDGPGNTVNSSPYPIQTLNQIVKNDQAGNISTTTYQYQGGKFYFGDSFDKRFAGFSQIKELDPIGNITKTYYHTGSGSDSAHGEYQDNFFKINKPYRLEKYDSSENLYSKTVNKWDSTSLGGNAGFVKLTQTTNSLYDGLSTHKDTAESYAYDNSNGNLTQKILWGEVSGSDDGSFTDVGTDKFIINFSFASSAGSNAIGKVSQETVYDQSSNKVKEGKYYYDNQFFGQVSLGNLTKNEAWKSGGDYINSQKSYNSYGLVVQETDPRGKQTTYSYDSYNLFPATITNPLSQSSQYTYDYSSGKVKQVTDPNSSISRTLYDGLDRVIEEKQSDKDSPSTLVIKATYSYTDTYPMSVQKRNYLDENSYFDGYSYLDGFGRTIQERIKAEDSNNYSVKDYVYNNRGLLYKESLPYFSTGSSRTSPTTNSVLYSIKNYDALERISSVIDASGTTSSNNQNWKLTITDVNSNLKDLFKDAFGRLIRVDEHNNGNTYSTNYDYNFGGKLKKITDSLGNVRNFVLDGLDRLTSSEDSHDPNDSTFGSYSYTYDNAGNLTSKTDPKSQVVNYTYDDLSRILTEDYTGQSGTEISYTYDTCSGGVGRICSIVTPDISTNYTYNSLGLIKTENKTINGTGYLTGYDYDRQGNLALLTNPDNSQVRYSYNSAGQINSVSRKESGESSFVDVVSNYNYNPAGKISLEEYNNGVTSNYTYDQDKLYRLSSKATTIGTSSLQNLSYTYDNIGNINQIVDSSGTNAAKTTNYGYDNLYRLTSAATSNAANGQNYSQSYNYNAIGNILNKSDIGDYIYAGNQGTSYANPHAATSVETIGHATSSVFTYDWNGNVLSDGTWNHSWDYDNRLASSTNGIVNINYAYDHEGNRVQMSTNGVATTTFVNKYYSVETGPGETATTTKNIFAGDQLIATIVGNGTATSTYYVHTDHLGGSSVITDEAGAVVQLLDYYPFGGERLNEKSGEFDERRKFTGHEYDSDTGLNYMKARYQNPTIGRFLSQDPEALRNPEKFLSDPQQLNMYSYARNNPISLVDPDGKTTKVNSETGKVLSVIQDKSTNIISVPFRGGQQICAPEKVIGRSFAVDTFEPGVTVHIGDDKTQKLYNSVKPANESKVTTALKSTSGGEYDIKKTWGYENAGDGVMFEGKYGTLEDMGNILAGINARVSGENYSDFQRTAGGLHQAGKVGAFNAYYFGKEYGPAPTYGETNRQYIFSGLGYWESYNNYIKRQK
ncbi:MAG: toxin TcdB middle/N-terminal domain-containing protein [Patescibacteria group bacterium]